MEQLRPQIHWESERLRSRHYTEIETEDFSRIPRSVEDTKTHAATATDILPNILRPLETSVVVRVLDHATKLVVTLSFFNPTDDILHAASFSFPFPSGCSLTQFRCFIGEEKVIYSRVKPNRDANAEFQGAIHNRKTAALVQQVTPEIFTADLGNIPPKTKLRAEVSLVVVLKDKLDRSENISTLTIPAYIAPRYGQQPPNFRNAVGRQIQSSVSISAEITVTDEIVEVVSKTHDIAVDAGRGPRPCHNWKDFARADVQQVPLYLATVKLKPPMSVLDRDFVLDIVTKPRQEPEVPYAWIETHHVLNDHHALMLTVPSNILLTTPDKNHKSEVVFLVDRSGSMSDKISSLKSAMRFFLRGIPRGRSFNIWSFGNSYSSLWPQSQAYFERTLVHALHHVNHDFEANMGGTELLTALQAIFRSRSTAGSSTTDIIVLTDGEVWHQEETIAFVASARKHSGYRVRLFCLGIGPAVSHTLVEGMARSGGGYAEVIPPTQKDEWEDRAVLMLNAALKTHVGPVQLEIGEETNGVFQ
jgi:hypothetical protein